MSLTSKSASSSSSANSNNGGSGATTTGVFQQKNSIAGGGSKINAQNNLQQLGLQLLDAFSDRGGTQVGVVPSTRLGLLSAFVQACADVWVGFSAQFFGRSEPYQDSTADDVVGEKFFGNIKNFTNANDAILVSNGWTRGAELLSTYSFYNLAMALYATVVVSMVFLYSPAGMVNGHSSVSAVLYFWKLDFTKSDECFTKSHDSFTKSDESFTKLCQIPAEL